MSGEFLNPGDSDKEWIPATTFTHVQWFKNMKYQWFRKHLNLSYNNKVFVYTGLFGFGLIRSYGVTCEALFLLRNAETFFKQDMYQDWTTVFVTIRVLKKQSQRFMAVFETGLFMLTKRFMICSVKNLLCVIRLHFTQDRTRREQERMSHYRSWDLRGWFCSYFF